MDWTPIDRRLLRSLLAGASPEELALEFELPKDQVLARLKRVMSVLGGAPERAGKPNSPSHRLSRLHDTWASRASSETLPAHRDFRLTDLRPWFQDIAIIEVTQSPLRLTPRLMGRNLITCAGADLSRRSLDGMLPARVRGVVLEPFARSIADKTPRYSVFTLPDRRLSRNPIHLLILPCASDGQNVDILIAAVQVEGADTDGCVHRAIGAYGRRVRADAFAEAIEARAEEARNWTERAVRDLTMIAKSGTSASAAARSTLAKYRSSEHSPPMAKQKRAVVS